MPSFVDRVFNAYINDNLDAELAPCHENVYQGCDGQKMSAAETAILIGALADGVITPEERAKLGFLPPKVVNDIAGDDGTLPARVRASFLIRELGHCKPERRNEVLKKLAALGSTVRSQFEPVALKQLEQRLADYQRLNKEHRALLQQVDTAQKLYDAAVYRHELYYEGLKNTPFPTDQWGQAADFLRNGSNAYWNANVKPFHDRLQKLRDALEQKRGSRDNELAAIRTLVGYLGQQRPAAVNLPDMAIKALQADTPAFELSKVLGSSITEGVDASHLAALKMMASRDGNPGALSLIAAIRTPEATEAIRQVASARGYSEEEISLSLARSFAQNGVQEEAVIERLSSAPPSVEKGEDQVYKAAFDRMSCRGLETVVQKRLSDEMSRMALETIVARFPQEAGAGDLIILACMDEKMPKSAAFATAHLGLVRSKKGQEILGRIITGEVNVSDDLRRKVLVLSNQEAFEFSVKKASDHELAQMVELLKDYGSVRQATLLREVVRRPFGESEKIRLLKAGYGFCMPGEVAKAIADGLIGINTPASIRTLVYLFTHHYRRDPRYVSAVDPAFVTSHWGDFVTTGYDPLGQVAFLVQHHSDDRVIFEGMTRLAFGIKLKNGEKIAGNPDWVISLAMGARKDSWVHQAGLNAMAALLLKPDTTPSIRDLIREHMDNAAQNGDTYAQGLLALKATEKK